MQSDHSLTSTKDSAMQVKLYNDANVNGAVDLIWGLSSGGQITMEVLSPCHDSARFALIESAAVILSPFTGAMIAPAFSSSCDRIKKRSCAKLQSASLKMKLAFFEDFYHYTCAVTKEGMIAFMKSSASYELPEPFPQCRSKVTVIYGENRLP